MYSFHCIRVVHEQMVHEAMERAQIHAASIEGQEERGGSVWKSVLFSVVGRLGSLAMRRHLAEGEERTIVICQRIVLEQSCEQGNCCEV